MNERIILIPVFLLAALMALLSRQVVSQPASPAVTATIQAALPTATAAPATPTRLLPATSTPRQAAAAVERSSAHPTAAPASPAQPTATSTPTPACDWKMVFQDEFGGDELDRERWRTDYPSGRTESQAYVPDVFTVDDGILQIKAEERRVKSNGYASGILTTQGKFAHQYGLFEIRARIPAGQGLWPAFWLLPTTKTYPWEIDVFEILGHEPETVYMSNHWPDESGENHHDTQAYTGEDFSKDFHTYSVRWTEDELTWYIDGEKRAWTNQGVPQEEMFMLVNLAVGGQWPGYPDDSTPFPSYLEVDYVRVYEWACPGDGAS